MMTQVIDDAELWRIETGGNLTPEPISEDSLRKGSDRSGRNLVSKYC